MRVPLASYSGRERDGTGTGTSFPLRVEERVKRESQTFSSVPSALRSIEEKGLFKYSHFSLYSSVNRDKRALWIVLNEESCGLLFWHVPSCGPPLPRSLRSYHPSFILEDNFTTRIFHFIWGLSSSTQLEFASLKIYGAAARISSKIQITDFGESPSSHKRLYGRREKFVIYSKGNFWFLFVRVLNSLQKFPKIKDIFMSSNLGIYELRSPGKSWCE